MKGNFRRPEPVFRSRDPGPRELKRRAFDAVLAKADVGSKPKPRPPVSPQSTKGPR
jgi:hypothetical protein